MARTLDKLTVEVAYNAAQATQGILDLTNALRGLGASVSGAAAGMSAISSAVRTIADIGPVSELISQEALDQFRQFAEIVNSLDQGKLDSLTDVLDGAAGVGTVNNIQGLTESIEGLSNRTNETASRFSRFTAESRNAETQTKKTSKAVKKQGGILTKLWTSMKRITWYRLVRGAFQALTKGIEEGITRLYKWSEIYNTKFVPAMDTFKTEMVYLSNGFASMFAPLIETVMPAFEHFVDTLVERSNVIQEHLAAIFNTGEWYKAVKVAKKYNEEVGKLKQQLAGFDELNVLTSDSGADEEDVSGMFQLMKVSSAVAESKIVLALKNLGRSFTDLWEKNLKPIYEQHIKPLFDHLLSETLPNAINLVAAAVDGLGAVIDLISPQIDGLFAGISFALRGIDDLLVGLTQLIDGSVSFENASSNVAKGIYKIIVGLIQGIMNAVLALEMMLAGFLEKVAPDMFRGMTDEVRHSTEVINKNFAAWEKEIEALDGAVSGSVIAEGFAKHIGTLARDADAAMNDVHTLSWDKIFDSSAAGRSLKGAIDSAMQYVEDNDATRGALMSFLLDADGWKPVSGAEKDELERKLATALFEATDMDYTRAMISANQMISALNEAFRYSFGGVSMSALRDEYISSMEPAITEAIDVIGEWTGEKWSGLGAASFQRFADSLLLESMEKKKEVSDNAEWPFETYFLPGPDTNKAIEEFGKSTEALFYRTGEESGKSFGTGFSNAFSDYFENAGGSKPASDMSKSRFNINMSEYASGGFPSQGSLFVAGEVAGQTELIGNINGRTGVVGGDEITGIADAVYSTGNAEAAILAQILAAINAKNLTIAPSAALGRAVAQSQRMYAGVTG
ncbi:MAG: hypothetical protein J6S14_21985 [Clostridia bacterium]|nr:hypothetical protein [Clostridia bacterium]